MRITLRQRKLAKKLATLITTLGGSGMSNMQIAQHLLHEGKSSNTKARSK